MQALTTGSVTTESVPVEENEYSNSLFRDTTDDTNSGVQVPPTAADERISTTVGGESVLSSLQSPLFVVLSILWNNH